MASALGLSRYNMSKAMPYLLSFGVVIASGGFLFLMDGAWQSYNQYIQSKIWPAVQARIVGCSVSGDWHYAGSTSSRSAWGETFQVRCTFAYNVGGIEHENIRDVGSAIFTPKDDRVYPTPQLTLPKMRDWVARHPTGSILTLHYDPGNPAVISLAGEDNVLLTTLPHDRLWFGIVSTVCGLALAVLSKVISAPLRSQ